jgi:hypothetical protein
MPGNIAVLKAGDRTRTGNAGGLAPVYQTITHFAGITGVGTKNYPIPPGISGIRNENDTVIFSSLSLEVSLNGETIRTSEPEGDSRTYNQAVTLLNRYIPNNIIK